MNILKTKETRDTFIIIGLLMDEPAFKDSPELRMTVRHNGFSLIDTNTERYLICSVLTDYDGIQIEAGKLDHSYANLVMHRLKNSETYQAATDIHRWFTKENGMLFEVAKNGDIPPYEAHRKDGELKRYALSNQS